MKKLNKFFIVILSAVVLSACLEENDPNYDIIGAVGTISQINVSDENPAVGETITVDILYFSENVAVKELRLNAAVGNGNKATVTTKSISDFNTDNSYTDSFSYAVPAGSSGQNILLEVEIVTANDLVNNKTETVTVQ